MQNTNFLKLYTETIPFFNVSYYLNDIKPIESLTLENLGDIGQYELEIRITSDLEFLEPFVYKIPYLPEKTAINIPFDSLIINRNYLSKTSEREKAIITIEIIEKEDVFISEKHTIGILPLEYFSGFQFMPELIASYVTPNNPYVYKIKRNAIINLEKQNLSAQFEGYQGNNVERVLQTISAIYSAIQSEEIIYSALPPGYEETGQRLRLLNTIEKEKFGNCIDLSLLFVACLEAINLNPLIIISKGHAYVGCWLIDDKFSETINEDKTAITKRLSNGIREIVVFEATSICRGNNIKFSEAMNIGASQLIQNENFILSVDLNRARSLRIRPIPLLNLDSEIKLDEETMDHIKMNKMEKNFEIGPIYSEDLLKDGKPKTKQKIWERNLLDLSLRNNLLNLSMTRNMLQLIDVDINLLEDTLSEGKSFSIMNNPNTEVLGKYNILKEPIHSSKELFQFANSELKNNHLLTYYHQKDLDNILNYINKNAKQSIEENGSSTLFLGIGLMKWFDRKTPSQSRFAPILLLPVELNRKSLNSKFELKSCGDESMINITLLEYLRQEYEINLSALEQLPMDEKGVDVSKILGILRRAIMHLNGWDILEQLVLGNFSFNKLILWKDIAVHEKELLQSDMVRSLILGRLDFENKNFTQKQTNFDTIPSENLFLPIPADVSQMEAVLSVQNGESFILHGPPGTGKSQTITNIIADSVYHNKKVLFVAAKKAALDVVHRRLEQIGLGPFSLELHSNKSKKSDVLNQLSRSLETSNLSRNFDFKQEAIRLDNTKKSISQYVNILHEIQPIGWSLYDCIVALEGIKENKTSKHYLSEEVIKQLNPQIWQQWLDWLPQFQSILSEIDNPLDNPLNRLVINEFSLKLSEEIKFHANEMLEATPNFHKQTQEFSDSVHFPVTLKSNTECEVFKDLIITIQDFSDIPFSLINYLSEKNNYITFKDWSKIYKQYIITAKKILLNFKRNILEYDITKLEEEWTQAEKKWFLQNWLIKKNIRKELSKFQIERTINDEEIVQLFTILQNLKMLKQKLKHEKFLELEKILRTTFHDNQIDITTLDSYSNKIQNLSLITNKLIKDSLKEWTKTLNENNITNFEDLRRAKNNEITTYLAFIVKYSELKQNFTLKTGISLLENDNFSQETINLLLALIHQLPNLKNWMIYVKLRKEGETLNLQWLIDDYLQKICSDKNLESYFLNSVYYSIAYSVISKNEALSLFNVNLFENKIEKYKNIVKDFRKLTIMELQSELSTRIPNNHFEAQKTTEIGILQRAIKNKGRGLSIRKLFDQIPNLLPKISPCMLMSPISVAQYFDVDSSHFDIVIFDEASQLPTCEAVSALARAKQCIIVGDPKQMPPTSFFNTIKLDEENMEVEDLESILDDCLSLSMPSKYLLRHYRSKHESLIAFSNLNYYENKLLTFPSYDDLNQKVKYHNVIGYYDKSKSSTNSFEADAIVEFIEAHLIDSRKRKLSIGIVTFSQKQQNLIEEKLQSLLSSNSELEKYALESSEPVFVKNLENVQGDERDIILFSICYAEDADGKVSMNFGPLNREGGWRRLNVAITRARYEMHIFATLKFNQIDLSRTSSEGVAGLKRFLQFAEKGQLTIHAQDVQFDKENKYLSYHIAKKLAKQGFKVKCNIGTSSFKVDIGIVHPEFENQYILGILIDSQNYYSAQTTNDREIVLPSVLESLGWNIFKIWSLDWFENSDRIINSIIEKINKIKHRDLVEKL